MSSIVSNQIGNRNFLSPLGFKFVLAKYPKVDFFSNSTKIPGINLGVAVQPSYLKDIPVPGDKISYDDFSLKFLVDENLENYVQIHNWMRGLGYPESVAEYQNLLNEDEYNPGVQNSSSGQSDGSLIVYNSNYHSVATINFKGLFPVSLSTINFDATNTDVQYVSAEVVFKYTLYDIITTPPPVNIFIPSPPTITLSANNLFASAGDLVTLSWTTTNASRVIIDNNVGTFKNVNTNTNVTFNGDITYTATAIGPGGTATSSVTITSMDITCIAVIDESFGSGHSFEEMEQKWTQFRQNWPYKRFYLLQPGNYGDAQDVLNLPPSFLEETDPLSITLNTPIDLEYPNKYGMIVTESDGTSCYNNITPIVNSDKVPLTAYGVILLGLSCDCSNLVNLIAFLNNNDNRSNLLSYLNSGGVIWFNSEWFNGQSSGEGCASKTNTNTVLTLLGSTIRQLADAPIVGNLSRSSDQKVIDSNFPSVMYCNATATFTGGTPVYTFTGIDSFGHMHTNTTCTTYEKIGNGILYVSGDVNTYDNRVYSLKPPNEMYTALRNLVLVQ